MSRREFDLALRRGQDRERALFAILDADAATIEVKDQSRSRTHVFIEFEAYGKPSGIAVTTADHWAIEVRPRRFLILPTDDLRALHERALSERGVSVGGDLMASRGSAVPKMWLVNE